MSNVLFFERGKNKLFDCFFREVFCGSGESREAKSARLLWREEGLQLPQRHKKPKRLYHKNSSVIRLRPHHQNHIWSIDFVHDKLTNGRGYKMLTVIDEYTREALCVAVRSKMNANDVLDVLFDLSLKY